MSSSTINPILYNVMSHRYRIAFKETLCNNQKRGYYSSANGFVRDQSSFRETTIRETAGRDHNLNYEGSQLVGLINFLKVTKLDGQ
jgi:neuromedin U receptor 1